MKITAFAAGMLLVASSVFAHVVVAPQQSRQGASQIYKVRVHNEEKVATTSIDLEVPDGVTVVSVAPLTTGKSSTAKTGGRIVKVTWETEVASGKYVELAFTARNPESATQVKWVVHEHMADGSVIDWSDTPGAQGKPSVTKIVPAAAAAAATAAK